MIEAMASSGSPSQLMRALISESFQNSQLITLKVGSNIHFQASVDSTVGMMKGSRMKALNTFVYTGVTTVFKLALGLWLALLLKQHFRGQADVRAFILLPFILPAG